MAGGAPAGAFADADEQADGPPADEPGYEAGSAARATGLTAPTARAPGRTVAEDDNADSPKRIPARRRLPVMSTVLLLFVLLIGGVLVAGYHYVRSQYYVGTQHGMIVIYQGVNERVLGLSLSSVAERTTIPLSAVPRSDAQVIQSAPAGGLSQARRIVTNVRHDYQTCQNAYAALRKWEAAKPKPKTVKRRVNGKIVTKVVTPPYHAPKPVVPADCPQAASQAASHAA